MNIQAQMNSETLNLGTLNQHLESLGQASGAQNEYLGYLGTNEYSFQYQQPGLPSISHMFMSHSQPGAEKCINRLIKRGMHLGFKTRMHKVLECCSKMEGA